MMWNYASKIPRSSSEGPVGHEVLSLEKKNEKSSTEAYLIESRGREGYLPSFLSRNRTPI